MKSKKEVLLFLGKKGNVVIEKIDNMSLSWLGVIIVLVILGPIFVLGKGAVFPVHDQLDETILNYVFSAKYKGYDSFPTIMCGAVGSTGLKPFAPIFVPLYKYLNPFYAFVTQYIVVITTAWFGTYLCVKCVTKSSISAVLAASVFALLPFRSIYGNQLSGIAMLLYCTIKLDEANESSRKKIILYYCGFLFFALSTSLMLIGYACIFMLAVCILFRWIRRKKMPTGLVIAEAEMVAVYLICNFDVVLQLLGFANEQSHREEFIVNGSNFFVLLKEYLLSGVALNESFHKFIFLATALALPFAIHKMSESDSKAKSFFATIFSILIIAALAAFLGSEFVAGIKNRSAGMVRTFQFQRFYLLLPGLWYILLGISLSIILVATRNKMLNLLLVLGVYMPTLLFVAKNPLSIFYQNVNQINNANITGYITWEKLYAEDIMNSIENDIGLPLDSYRVGSIGIPPVVSLMHGFYTVDGYSNNYPLAYKGRFAEIIEDELSLNDYCYEYFHSWGSRCYLFSHELGGNYYIGKSNNATLNDFRFNAEKMKELGCKYIFSAAEIIGAEDKNLKFFGVYETPSSFWRVWVYEL